MPDEQPIVPETPTTPEPPAETPTTPETPETPVTPEPEKEEEIDIEKLEPEVRTTKKADDTPTPGDDIELDPEDEKKISKVVSKQTAPLQEALKEVQRLKDEAEVNGFTSANPEYAKYKPAILKFMQHPAYANIPVHNIAAIVASKDLLKLGAAKEREAAKKAAETKDPGTTVRKQTVTTDWKSAPKEDFEAQKARVLGYGN